MELYPNSFVLVGTGAGLLSYLFCRTIISGLLLSKSSDTPRQPKDQRPPTLPYSIPWIKSTFAFLFDGPNLFRYASKLHSPLRIALLQNDIYIIHGAKNISEIFKAPSTSIHIAYGIALKHCFGMAQKAVSTYFDDTSGPQVKPIPGSNVDAQARVSHQTHEVLVKGLLGPGLAPTYSRFENNLTASLQTLGKDGEWMEYPDFLEFFEDVVGKAIVEAIFGSELLSQNPEFVRDLWTYDAVVMSLARRLPAFCNPQAHRVRRKLLGCIKRWHEFARAKSGVRGDSDGNDFDPVWGSRMMRERQDVLLGIQNQDYDSVAATDLAFIWAVITNVVPSSMTLALHAFRDESLLHGIRQGLQSTSDSESAAPKFDMRQLEKHDLLMSMYAETLRFSVQIHIPRTTPHRDLNIGGKVVPKNKLMLVNTWLAHTAEDVWNTKDNAFPLSTFWGRRFLVDPSDPSSGPCKKPAITKHSQADAPERGNAEFSTEGLKGAWIPFGGGHHACPGRVLAKRIMLMSCASMTTMFDVEILAQDGALEYSDERFGFGVRKPVGKVPFRMRRRRDRGGM